MMVPIIAELKTFRRKCQKVLSDVHGMCGCALVWCITIHIQVDREETHNISTRRTKALAKEHIENILSQPTETSRA